MSFICINLASEPQEYRSGLRVQPYLQIMKSTAADCAVKPGCVFSFVHHKHINGVNPGCCWNYHIFPFYHFWYFIWFCLHWMIHSKQICHFTAAAQLALKIQFSSSPEYSCFPISEHGIIGITKNLLLSPTNKHFRHKGRGWLNVSKPVSLHLWEHLKVSIDVREKFTS